MSLQIMKSEPIEDRNPESIKISSKDPVVNEPSGWFRQTATKLLWSDLKDSMALLNDLKPSEVTILVTIS